MGGGMGQKDGKGSEQLGGMLADRFALMNTHRD